MKALSFYEIPVSGLKNSATLGRSGLGDRQKRKVLAVWNDRDGENIQVKFTTHEIEFRRKATFIRQQDGQVLNRTQAIFGINAVGYLIVDEDKNVISQKPAEFSPHHAAAVLVADPESGPNKIAILVYIPSQDWRHVSSVPRPKKNRTDYSGGWRNY